MPVSGWSDLRGRLFEHLRRSAFIITSRRVQATRSTASTWTRISIENLVMSGMFPLASSVITLAVMFAILAKLDVTVALLSLSVVPFLYLCLATT
jgi:ABC-type multidrug transport system fused ATPase/permease subunit